MACLKFMFSHAVVLQPPLEILAQLCHIIYVYTQAQRGFQYLLDETPEAQDPDPSPRQTAFMMASSSGTNQLQVRGKYISLAVLSGSVFMGMEEIGGIGTYSQ